MKLPRKMEIESVVGTLLVLYVLYMLFFGGYHLIRPSTKGEKILERASIPYPAVIAHRGASSVAPESTVPAYRIAMDQGADYLEADIQRTKDGRLVVFHDKSLQRTTDVENKFPARKNDYVSSFTLEEIEQLDNGSWFNNKYPLRARQEYADLKVLTLDKLLEMSEEEGKSTGIVLDVKVDERNVGIVDDIVELLHKHGKISNSEDSFAGLIVFSFDLNILKRFKELAPGIPRVLLIDRNRISRRQWDAWLNMAADYVHGIGVKGFVSWPWHIAKAHDRNLFVFPYVIKELWHLRIMAHLKSSGYITNRPDMVAKFLQVVP